MEINCDTAIEASCFDDLVINFYTELPLDTPDGLQLAKRQHKKMCDDIESIIETWLVTYNHWRLVTGPFIPPIEEMT